MDDKIKKQPKEKKQLTVAKTKTKRRLHFNVIDVVIIVLVLACIGGVIARYTVLGKLTAKAALKYYYISFTAEGVKNATTDAFSSTVSDEKNNWVYLSDGRTEVGTMTQANSVPVPIIYLRDENDRLVEAEYADVEGDKEYIDYNVTGLIRCRGLISGSTGGFMLNGDKSLVPGTTLELHTKYGDFKVVVNSIDVAKEQE